MLTKNLATLFERDILKLKTEINTYTEEKKLWITVPGTSNPGGNLCLHLLGNLQYYIGTILGNSGYIRDREKEFSQKDVPRKELNQTIDTTTLIIAKTLRNVSPQTAKPLPAKGFYR